MTQEYNIPEGYEARVEGNKVIIAQKESEDEKIRKRLIDCLKLSLKGAEEQDAAGCSRQKDIEAYKWGLAYLAKQKEQVMDESDKIAAAYQLGRSDESKQKEQKPAKWSEEDSRILYNVIAYIGYAAGQRGVRDDEFKEATSWLKSLPNGFIVNPNYNEDMVNLLVAELQNDAKRNDVPRQYDAEISWLKSLRPQPHWKPSEEQMRALWEIYQGGKAQAPIASLYEDLKKL